MTSAPQPRAQTIAKFTQGSVARHVVVMTASGSIGLMAIFLVDFLNLFYISLLGHPPMTAAIGYAGTILFFVTSVGIGISISVTALVSRALGEKDRDKARRLAASGLLYMLLAMIGLCTLLTLFAGPLLALIGAKGETADLAWRFLMISMPSMPFLGLGMAFSGVLRAVGDAKRSMWVTLGGGLATAALDPLFIFTFGMGFDGAAIVTILARLIFCGIGFHGAVRVHQLLGRLSFPAMRADLPALNSIAIAAVLTNIATPVANGYLTHAFAGFGDEAVAAWAIIGRLVSLIFGAIFALSGAVGPIIGQNLGAKLYPRVRETLTASLMLTMVYVLFVWALLALARHGVSAMFNASGETAELIDFFCLIVAGTWLFMGALFVANAAFNNLGVPLASTFFNWGRATIGTVPFAMLGGHWYGAKGVLLGQGLGSAAFGICAVFVAYWVIGRLGRAPPQSSV